MPPRTDTRMSTDIADGANTIVLSSPSSRQRPAPHRKWFDSTAPHTDSLQLTAGEEAQLFAVRREEARRRPLGARYGDGLGDASWRRKMVVVLSGPPRRTRVGARRGDCETQIEAHAEFRRWHRLDGQHESNNWGQGRRVDGGGRHDRTVAARATPTKPPPTSVTSGLHFDRRVDADQSSRVGASSTPSACSRSSHTSPMSRARRFESFSRQR